MILHSLHSSGYLDISSQEQLENESEHFRLCLLPGQTVTIDNKWRKLRNINTAINDGLLEVLSYNELPDANVVEQQIFYKSGISFIVDNGSNDITQGIKCDFTIPYKCNISSVSLLSTNTIPGTISIDLWKCTESVFPPTIADSITGANYVKLINQIKNVDTTLTNWTTTISTNDTIRAYVVSNATDVKRITVNIKFKRQSEVPP